MRSSNRYATQLSCLNGGARLVLSHRIGPTLQSTRPPTLGSADGGEFVQSHGLTPSQALRSLQSLARARPGLPLPQVLVLGQSRCLHLGQCRNRSRYLDRYRIPLRLTSGRLTQAQIRLADGTVGRLLIGKPVLLGGCGSAN